MEVVSLWETRTLWTCSAQIWQRLSHHTNQLTTQLLWNHASMYHLAESRTFPKLSFKPSSQHQNKPSQWIHSAVIIACSSIDLLCKEEDGGLWLCADCRALKTATLTNRYALPWILEMIERLRGAQIFTKLDLRNAYHLIQMNEGDKYKTKFHTRYRQFEYPVMLFGLSNTPATFQAYIDDSLRPIIGDFALCYLDDILIYSTNEEEHEEQVQIVLERLQEFGLYGMAEKWRFRVSEVGCLSFFSSSDGSAMQSDCISMIDDGPTPESCRDVQMLLGFTNFYRWFIRKYAMVTTPLSDLLRIAENSRMSKKVKWEWTWDAKLGFWKLTRAFYDALILKHFELAGRIILQTDASGFAKADIFIQSDGFGIRRPVNFYCQKCSGAEQNHDT